MKTETVPQEIIDKAYYHFVEMFYPNQNGMGLHLWAFLGMTKSPTYYGDPWTLPTQAAHNARLLAGPHYKTVAKIMLARGYQHKVPL